MAPGAHMVGWGGVGATLRLSRDEGIWRCERAVRRLHAGLGTPCLRAGGRRVCRPRLFRGRGVSGALGGEDGACALSGRGAVGSR